MGGTEQPKKKRSSKKQTNTTQLPITSPPKLPQDDHPVPAPPKLPQDDHPVPAIPKPTAEAKQGPALQMGIQNEAAHASDKQDKHTYANGKKDEEENANANQSGSINYVQEGTRLAPGKHEEYKPLGGIASGFNSNCHPITLEDMIQLNEKESEDEEDKELTEQQLADLTTTKFLFVMLLGIAKAQADTKIDFTAFKKQKRGKMQTSYKHKYLFASLNDNNLGTCVILEKNNDEHNVHWTWNQSKQDVTIGIRLAIQNPRLVGYLPTQSAIIETKLPFIMLSSPQIHPAPIIADTTAHVMKYFVLKEHKIQMVKGHLPVPFKTSCNASFCDRLAFRDKHNTICGCWGAFSKNDSTTRNAVLQFDFKFKANGKMELVNNFTSLRTSRLFFAGERIIADVEALTVHENTRIIQEKFLRTLHYINNHRGWTIAGWYIRGQKQNDEHKEDNEESLLSEGDVRINVSYLYPTQVKHKDIPLDNLFQQKDLYTVQATTPTQMNNHNL